MQIKISGMASCCDPSRARYTTENLKSRLQCGRKHVHRGKIKWEERHTRGSDGHARGRRCGCVHVREGNSRESDGNTPGRRCERSGRRFPARSPLLLHALLSLSWEIPSRTRSRLLPRGCPSLSRVCLPPFYFPPAHVLPPM